ncbi:hypothetical protein NPA07_03670 [Mycoplasmopsis caviae]|uniref:Transposase n=1 Tax=Mycoplasmopsis caviae TaxID=55603 RepID=A0ABY5IXP4_9BACT|nr:hypothetical protein [Mycoplasmopsis caviae]UUD34883.1 hypothetical protein NPA07_03670 [Mycoplasmopsis caviae]
MTGYVKPTQHKKTRRNVRNYLIALTKTEDKNINKKQLYIKIKSIDNMENVKRLPRTMNSVKFEFGEQVQADACYEAWIKELDNFHIYTIVETSSKMLVSIYAEKEETTIGYMKLLNFFIGLLGFQCLLEQIKERAFLTKGMILN